MENVRPQLCCCVLSSSNGGQRVSRGPPANRVLADFRFPFPAFLNRIKKYE